MSGDVRERDERVVSGRLSRLRLLLEESSALERAQHSGMRKLRERFVLFETALLRAAEREKLVRLVEEDLGMSHGSSSTSSSGGGGGPDDGRRRKSLLVNNYNSKPFGFSQELGYRSMLRAFKALPEQLADLLTCSVVQSSLKRPQADQLAHAIVYDVYGRQDESAMLRFLGTVLSRTAADRASDSQHSFVARCTHHYLQLAGADFLRHALGESVVEILRDDELVIDLMPSSGSMDSLDDDDEDGGARPSQQQRRRSQPPPPPSNPPPHSQRRPSLTDPITETPSETPGTRPGGNVLFLLCSRMLRALLENADSVPFGVRYLAKVKLSLKRGEGKEDLVPTAQELATVGDFVLLNWVVNAINFPELYGLSGCHPITIQARHNLQAVGTVLVKLITGSRFTAFQQNHLAAINEFLDEMEPQLNNFLSTLVADVCDSDLFDGAEMKDAGLVVVRPKVMLPNSLFLLHRLMLGVFPPKSKHNQTNNSNNNNNSSPTTSVPPPPNTPPPFQSRVPRTDTEAAGLLRDALKRIGSVPAEPLPPEQNVYVLVDSGLPDMEVPSVDVLADRQGDALDAETRAAFRALITIVRSIPDTKIMGRGSLEDVVSAYVRRARFEGNVAVGVILSESLNIIRRCSIDGSVVMERLLARATDARTRLLQSEVWSGTLFTHSLLEDATEQLIRARESRTNARWRNLQISRLIEATLPRVRALGKYLSQRSAKLQQQQQQALRKQAGYRTLTIASDSYQSYTPSALTWATLGKDGRGTALTSTWVDCGGKCPFAWESDRFLCQRCDERLKTNLRVVIGFLNKYASTVPERFHELQDAIGPRISMRQPDVMSEVTDFIVAANFGGLFVTCRAADDTFYQLLEMLSKRYPDFASFYAASGIVRRPAAAPSGRGTDGETKTGDEVEDEKAVSHRADVEPMFDTALAAAVHELNSVQKQTSVSRKLDGFVRCRTIITTFLQNIGSLHLVGRDSSVTLSGADDYMPLLCYVIMVANPVRFLSNVQFVQTVQFDSLNAKGFVDVLVAIKFLLSLEPGAPPAPDRRAAAAAAARDAHNAATVSTAAPAAEIDGQLQGMGFAAEDVAIAREMLSDAVLGQQADGGFGALLDFLTDLACLKEMGYSREVSAQAIVASGHNISRATHYILAQQQ